MELSLHKQAWTVFPTPPIATTDTRATYIYLSTEAHLRLRQQTHMIVEGEAENFEVFRDCLSTTVIEKLVPRTATGPKKRAAKGRKNGSHPAASDAGNDEVQSNDAAELSDFVEVLHPISHLLEVTLTLAVLSGGDLLQPLGRLANALLRYRARQKPCSGEVLCAFGRSNTGGSRQDLATRCIGLAVLVWTPTRAIGPRSFSRPCSHCLHKYVHRCTAAIYTCNHSITAFRLRDLRARACTIDLPSSYSPSSSPEGTQAWMA